MSTIAQAEPVSRPSSLPWRILDGLVTAFPMFSPALFVVYLGLMVWGALWLRDKNLGEVLRLWR
ncbi:MAG: hypothetical protein ACREDL_24105 [Bradyrhizobium sp.]